MLSSELARSILDSAPDAMLLIDSTAHIAYANRQVSALFGYGDAELTGQPVDTLLPDRILAHPAERARPVAPRLDALARRKDGSELPVEITLSTTAEGSVPFLVAAIREATERRQAQQVLRAALDAAERANHAKSRFLATASHDLRQPMQALSLLNGTMRRMAPGAAFADALEQEAQSITAMSALLNALLDISKLESGAVKPEISDFRVHSLFEELRREYSSLAAAKGLSLEIADDGDCIHSDASLVGQVVRNFVSNAIKYTQRGTVSVRCEPGAGRIRVVVRDTGVGIPAHELSHIFEDFYQVGVASNTTRDGYGLGLGIVARIAQLLSAELGVASQPGRGTEISIWLPSAAAAPVAHARSAPAKKTRAPRACVLFVDDDERVRKATRALLKVEGFDVHIAASVGEAVMVACTHPQIGLLVTDYHLANGETGVQVIDALREILGVDLPAVMITGDTSSAMSGLGVDHRLRVASKPIDPDELLRVMDELVSARADADANAMSRLTA